MYKIRSDPLYQSPEIKEEKWIKVKPADMPYKFNLIIVTITEIMFNVYVIRSLVRKQKYINSQRFENTREIFAKGVCPSGLRSIIMYDQNFHCSVNSAYAFDLHTSDIAKIS
jgi:hypothetical protein